VTFHRSEYPAPVYNIVYIIATDSIVGTVKSTFGVLVVDKFIGDLSKAQAQNLLYAPSSRAVRQSNQFFLAVGPSEVSVLSGLASAPFPISPVNPTITISLAAPKGGLTTKDFAIRSRTPATIWSPLSTICTVCRKSRIISQATSPISPTPSSSGSCLRL
jgi:hypothetical protein